MNIVSIFTLDHTMDYELTHCEQIAKVTIRIKVNFDKKNGELIIEQYEIIDRDMFIVGMNDEEFAMFILSYAQ